MANKSTFDQWLYSLFPELKEVNYSEVRIDEKELQRLGANSPAITIFSQGTREHINTGSAHYKEVMTAFVIVADCCDESRGAMARRIAITMANNLPRATTDHIFAVEHESISTTSLTTTGIDSMGLSMWGITWQQMNRIKQEL